mgnify:CR=1 FL=1
MTVRLSGAPPALASARGLIGGDLMTPEAAAAWWQSLREQTHAFFSPGQPLWRLALPPTTADLELGPTLIEWGGGQRWLSGPHDAAQLRDVAAQRQPAGGDDELRILNRATRLLSEEVGLRDLVQMYRSTLYQG